MRRKQQITKKICRECGKLRELLLFRKWGKHKVCMDCEEREEEKMMITP